MRIESKYSCNTVTITLCCVAEGVQTVYFHQLTTKEVQEPRFIEKRHVGT